MPEQAKRRLRILVVATELPPSRSGVALSAGLLVERYRQAGHEVDTFVMHRLPKWIWREIRLSFFFLRWPSLRRGLGNYDCVHVHGPAPTFSDLLLLLLWLARGRSPRPTIVYTHHFEIDFPRFRLPSELYNRSSAWIHRLADATVVTTRAYGRLLRDRGHQNVQVIHWGADHRSYLPPGRAVDRFDILTVAQLRPYKGIDVLLRAFQKLPTADLHVVGEGHRRKSYEALAVRLGLSRVHFHGELSDPELCARLSAAHVIVLSSVSRMEAFGISLLEGMSTGCVPIVSDLPGVAEVVKDAGLHVPPGDSDALAEALLRLHRDPVLWEKLSMRAIRRARSFRWQETADTYMGLFQRLTRSELEGSPLPAALVDSLAASGRSSRRS